MDATRSSASPQAISSTTVTIPARRRPCDACRRRKSRCEFNEGQSSCVLCKFHRQPCLFNEDPQPRKKRKVDVDGGELEAEVRRLNDGSQIPFPEDVSISEERRRSSQIRQAQLIDDYANLKGPSLLKRTLGLQNHRHSSYIGLTSEYEQELLKLDTFKRKDETSLGRIAVREPSDTESFLLMPDRGTLNYDEQIHDLDDIEEVVAPHGHALINLYFRIVHPSFPVLHKAVFIEKYKRTHREFSPPLLAAVYILALNWWSYSSELSLLPKPDVLKLEKLAIKTMSYITFRPKLSTIQAGLLLLQRPEGDSWALTGKLVAVAQELGLHLDCSRWRIPPWERGLRKRLAWALYMQDKWGALVHGRPSHINPSDWLPRHVTEDDFPERAADEDDEEGSTEVEKGRILFSEMIRLTEILSSIISEFYTLRAEEEFRQRAVEGVGWVLERAKPIQLRLKEWYSQLPECLKMENVKMRKLNSSGYLHLAYYAAEMTLHRRIVRSLAHEENPSLIIICRTAAQARLSSVTDFVGGLRPEFLQSFWHSSSKYSFALVGTFISLLWVTATNKEEAEKYQQRLEEYRWTLRLLSKSSDILDRAVKMLTSSTGVLIKAIPEKRDIARTDLNTKPEPSPEYDVNDVDDIDISTSTADNGSNGLSPPQISEEALILSWHDFNPSADDFYSLPDAVNGEFMHPYLDVAP